MAGKNPTPAEYGARGGTERARRLSTEERREIARRGAQARWARLTISDPTKLPEADTDGVLTIGDVQLDVYVLADKRRLISKRAMARALHLKSEGGNAFRHSMSSKGIRSRLPVSVIEKIEKPIVFKPLRGDSADGYEATLLIEICDAIIQARNDNKLSVSQRFLAMQAEIIIRSAAKIGIIALIDEATGYTDKTKDEYRRLFAEFIRKECRQWEQEYPDKFFDMLYRIYNLKRQKPDTTRHPQFFAHCIRRYIYYPLAGSRGAILEQLEHKNPVVYTGGGRRFKLFQFLSDQVGVPAFRQHLWQVVGIGEASADKVQFERGFYRAFPEAIPRKATDQLDFLDKLKI